MLKGFIDDEIHDEVLKNTLRSLAGSQVTLHFSDSEESAIGLSESIEGLPLCDMHLIVFPLDAEIISMISVTFLDKSLERGGSLDEEKEGADYVIQRKTQKMSYDILKAKAHVIDAELDCRVSDYLNVGEMVKKINDFHGSLQRHGIMIMRQTLRDYIRLCTLSAVADQWIIPYFDKRYLTDCARHSMSAQQNLAKVGDVEKTAIIVVYYPHFWADEMDVRLHRYLSQVHSQEWQGDKIYIFVHLRRMDLILQCYALRDGRLSEGKNIVCDVYEGALLMQSRYLAIVKQLRVLLSVDPRHSHVQSQFNAMSQQWVGPLIDRVPDDEQASLRARSILSQDSMVRHISTFVCSMMPDVDPSSLYIVQSRALESQLDSLFKKTVCSFVERASQQLSYCCRIKKSHDDNRIKVLLSTLVSALSLSCKTQQKMYLTRRRDESLDNMTRQYVNDVLRLVYTPIVVFLSYYPDGQVINRDQSIKLMQFSRKHLTFLYGYTSNQEDNHQILQQAKLRYSLFKSHVEGYTYQPQKRIDSHLKMLDKHFQDRPGCEIS